MSQAFHLQPFWQELLIELFRVPVRVALRINKSQHQNLERLLKVAIYRELDSMDLTQSQAATLIGGTDRTVRNYQTEARKLRRDEPKRTPADKILQAVRQEPRSIGELTEATWSDTNPIDVDWLMALLQHQGYLQRKKGEYGESLYGAGPKLDSLRALNFAESFDTDEKVRAAQHILIRNIDRNPGITREGLEGVPEISTFPLPVISQALEGLIELGVVMRGPQGLSEAQEFYLTDGHVDFRAEERTTRLRSGLREFTEKMAWAVEMLFASPNRDLNTQRIFHYESTPGQVKEFYKQLRTFVRQSLIEIDESSVEDSQRRSFLFFWHGGPSPEEL